MKGQIKNTSEVGRTKSPVSGWIDVATTANPISKTQDGYQVHAPPPGRRSDRQYGSLKTLMNAEDPVAVNAPADKSHAATPEN